MFAINPNDEFVTALTSTKDVTFINNFRALRNDTTKTPVVFRSMAQRKTVTLCKQQQRDFYYIDTGYLGNVELSSKRWFRVVKNNVQHTKPNYNMPEKRFNKLVTQSNYIKFDKWKKEGKNILIVTPSDKPCKFYSLDKSEWLNNTIQKLKEHTDRQIIIREKDTKENRLKDTIYNQIDRDNIFAVVTFNSIAAIEALCYGIPVFTSAPTAADNLCLKDLDKIENPLYEDITKVEKWQHWLAYCQYSFLEMQQGLPFQMIKEYNLQ